MSGSQRLSVEHVALMENEGSTPNEATRTADVPIVAAPDSPYISPSASSPPEELAMVPVEDAEQLAGPMVQTSHVAESITDLVTTLIEMVRWTVTGTHWCWI